MNDYKLLVDSTDASAQLVGLVRRHTGQPIRQIRDALATGAPVVDVAAESYHESVEWQGKMARLCDELKRQGYSFTLFVNGQEESGEAKPDLPCGEPAPCEADGREAGSRRCVVCGKLDRTELSADLIIGRPSAVADTVGKCQSCGARVCGACATPRFSIYVGQEHSDAASTFVQTENLRGRHVGEIMDEAYARFGAEILVKYGCPRCSGEIGAP